LKAGNGMAYIKLTYHSAFLNQTTEIAVFFPYIVDDDIKNKKGQRNRAMGDPGRANHTFGMGGAGKPVELPLRARLPMDDGTYDKEQRYQVLYLISGGGGDLNDWSVEAGIENMCTQAQLAVVMPTIRDFNRMQKGADYFRYVAEELPAFIRYLFPVSDRREDTFLAGFSYGGYYAMQLGLNYAENYANVASFGGPVDVLMDIARLHADHDSAAKVNEVKGTDKDVLWLAEQRKKQGMYIPRLFISVGTEDFTWDFNISARKRFEELGIDLTWDQGPGIHSYEYCTQHFQKMLDWLPLKKGPFYPGKEA